jgi:hypothetical protein
MQTELLTKRTVSSIGEEISQELGAKFIRDYQNANPSDVHSYVIGKDIISQILAQPGCAGIKFYNALNEKGEKTLVYLGLNENGQEIVEYSAIDNCGILKNEQAIVADRAGTGKGSTPFGGGGSWWEND